MPIGSVSSGQPARRRAAAGGVARPSAHPPLAVMSDAPQTHTQAVGIGALSSRDTSALDPALNQQIAGAQQALEFLDQLGTQLQSLRGELSRRLAPTYDTHGNPVASTSAAADTATLDAKIQTFDESLQRLSAATGGTLDCQLGYSACGDSRQRFTVRGLEMSSLRANASSETLNFSVGGQGHATASSVTIEPGLSNAALVHRFDRALARSGVRATVDAQGELDFSVKQADWPNVREAIAVQGEGRRFPTGQFNQVRTVPATPALRPNEWSTQDLAALRNTRQEVFKAQGMVRQARLVVSQALAETGSRLAKPAVDAVWSSEFTQGFAALAKRSDYLALSAMTPALMGISRERVMTLLSLPLTSR